MDDYSISVDQLSVNYGEVRALSDVTIKIRPGRICGLVGMNGSGKSTLFKSLVGQVRPRRGSITIMGASPGQAKKKSLIGYTPQSESVDWRFPISVREVVMTGRYAYMGGARNPRKIDQEEVNKALEITELTELAYRQIGQLSGGQRKRAFIARSIAQKAKIILLDEPFAGVDKYSEGTITRMLHQLSDSSCTILVSTHDLDALPSLCSEAILLKNRVLLHDLPEIVLAPENLAMAFGLKSSNASSQSVLASLLERA